MTYNPRLAKVKVGPHAKKSRSNGSNRRAPRDKRTDTHTDATKRIISPATWSIMIAWSLHSCWSSCMFWCCRAVLSIVNVDLQLVEELSQELDELRTFKAEFMSMSKSDLPADVSQRHRRQLESLVTHLKQVLSRSSNNVIFTRYITLHNQFSMNRPSVIGTACIPFYSVQRLHITKPLLIGQYDCSSLRWRNGWNMITARVLASQAEAIVRTGKHGHNIE